MSEHLMNRRARLLRSSSKHERNYHFCSLSATLVVVVAAAATMLSFSGVATTARRVPSTYSYDVPSHSAIGVEANPLGVVAFSTDAIVGNSAEVREVARHPSVDIVAPNTIRGGAGPVRVGQAGENAVRGAYDIGPKVTVSVNGRTRILDGLTDSTVTEVKNVQSLSLTQQLRDSLAYAQTTGRRFDLYVRPNTQLTRPLQDAITSGDIALRFIP